MIGTVTRIIYRKTRNHLCKYINGLFNVKLERRMICENHRSMRDCIDPDRLGLSPFSVKRDEIVKILKTYFPEQVELILRAADRAVNGCFELLGSKPFYFGTNIDWHLDFIHNYHFNPKSFFIDIKPASYPGGYDIKVPWELSRFQHLVWIGQAYWLTEDEKYPQAFVTQVTDWIARNPYPWGVNWACAMEAAIRVVNWLLAYFFMHGSPAVQTEFRELFANNLWLHGKHIWRNLENLGVTNNHYIANLVGLLCLGFVCHGFREAKSWREFSLRELEKEVHKQVHDDGVSFEASTSYHRFTLEMLLFATIVAQMNGYSFSPAFITRLQKMLEFIMNCVKPDGTIPLVGDHDNGRLHRLKIWQPGDREWIDFRYLLAIGAVVFDREDFACFAEDQWEEAIWLFGGKCLRYLQALKDSRVNHLRKSRAYPEGGIYLIHHCGTYVMIRCGAAPNNLRSHAHNDCLSFEFFTQGVTWIVDPGCYVYTSDYEARNIFRSTKYHNTICIDGKEQSNYDPKNAFSLLTPKREKVFKWEDADDFVQFVGQHDGYLRDQIQVIHRRRFILLKKPVEFLYISDELLGEGRHKVEFFLHLGEVRIEDLSDIFVKLSSHENNLFIFHPGGIPCRWKVNKSWQSTGYGHRKENQMLCLEQELCLPTKLSIILYPCQKGHTIDQVIPLTTPILNKRFFKTSD